MRAAAIEFWHRKFDDKLPVWLLAGGCAVGAGMTGGAIFALTAWITLVGMWLGAGLTDRMMDGAQPASK